MVIGSRHVGTAQGRCLASVEGDRPQQAVGATFVSGGATRTTWFLQLASRSDVVIVEPGLRVGRRTDRRRGVAVARLLISSSCRRVRTGSTGPLAGSVRHRPRRRSVRRSDIRRRRSRPQPTAQRIPDRRRDHCVVRCARRDGRDPRARQHTEQRQGQVIDLAGYEAVLQGDGVPADLLSADGLPQRTRRQRQHLPSAGRYLVDRRRQVDDVHRQHERHGASALPGNGPAGADRRSTVRDERSPCRESRHRRADVERVGPQLEPVPTSSACLRRAQRARSARCSRWTTSSRTRTTAPADRSPKCPTTSSESCRVPARGAPLLPHARAGAPSRHGADALVDPAVDELWDTPRTRRRVAAPAARPSRDGTRRPTRRYARDRHGSDTGGSVRRDRAGRPRRRCDQGGEAQRWRRLSRAGATPRRNLAVVEGERAQQALDRPRPEGPCRSCDVPRNSSRPPT